MKNQSELVIKWEESGLLANAISEDQKTALADNLESSAKAMVNFNGGSEQADTLMLPIVVRLTGAFEYKIFGFHACSELYSCLHSEMSNDSGPQNEDGIIEDEWVPWFVEQKGKSLIKKHLYNAYIDKLTDAMKIDWCLTYPMSDIEIGSSLSEKEAEEILKWCVEREEYELAAKLRDRINGHH